VTNFCQFKGGRGGGGGVKQWLLPQKKKIYNILNLYFFKVILKDLKKIVTP
jgi:hypothetical protein